MLIYHVVLPEVWEHFRTRPSYRAESLQSEGFIHCSYESQLEGVLKRYYSEVDRVFILSIDTAKLLPKLVEEPSTNGEMFPHIYGRINRNSVVEVKERNLMQAAVA
ncbi:DUF952 domain-containing protein [soil metagenome]